MERKTSMIARLWRTQVDLKRLAKYEQFAQEQSLPMFRQQRGFLGVFFLREHHNCLVLSLWEHRTAVEALATSATYQLQFANCKLPGFSWGNRLWNSLRSQAARFFQRSFHT